MPSAAVESIRPTTSNRGVSGSRLVGTRKTVSAIVSAATAAQKMNAAPQSVASTIAPPMIGPTATDAPVAAPQMPMAWARSTRSGKTLEMIDSVVGKTTAAPSPASARPKISHPGSGAKADSTDAAR